MRARLIQPKSEQKSKIPKNKFRIPKDEFRIPRDCFASLAITKILEFLVFLALGILDFSQKTPTPQKKENQKLKQFLNSPKEYKYYLRYFTL